MNENEFHSKGGKARAAALSDEQREEFARKAALARWGDRPIQAIRKGNFKEHFGIDVDCYVLDDVQKTAVISQSGMGKALGLSVRGNAFPRFLGSRAMADSLGAQLKEKLSQPIKYQWSGPGAQPPTIIHGFDVTLLIDVCKAIIQVESRLNSQQKHVAMQAHLIIGASAKSGIKGLVWALAGYNPTTQEVITAFKTYVQDEAKKYEKEFPAELYEQWHRLYQIPVLPQGRSWYFKHLTVNHIYYPLAQSNGKIYQLVKALKAKGGDKRKKLFQFLSEVGARALRMHMGRVLEMSESSKDKGEYERRISDRFGEQKEFNFETPNTAA
jgi:hypothetical protein